MRSRVILVMLATGSVAAAQEPAPAPGNAYLEAAKRLYADLEYEKALEQLDHARLVPGNTVAEQAEIEKYTGLVKFELGSLDARSSFRTALALDPKAELPPGASPKIRAEWTALKQEMVQANQARDAAAAKAEPPPPPVAKVEPPPVPKVDVPPAPPVAAAEPAKVDLRPSPTPAAAAAISQAAPAPEPRSMVASVGPWVLLGTGVVAGGIGGFMGISANNEVSSAKSDPVQLSAQSHQQAASSDALAANVLYAAAGAAVIGGAIWYFTR
jgi:hypothetical protein